MDIKRSGSQPSGKGQAEFFTGNVRIDPCSMQRSLGARAASVSPSSQVPGQPGHSHPLGQTPIVTAGCHLVQNSGGSIEEIQAGDVVWSASGEKHWYGATPSTAMTHISIVEQLDGKGGEWMEHVSDDQYLAGTETE